MAIPLSGRQTNRVYNNGNMQRDFTYIDDIVEGIVRVLDNHKDNPRRTGASPVDQLH